MWAMIQRIVVPMLLLAGSTASLFYGAWRHSAPVVADQEKEVTIEIPADFPPVPGDQFPPMPGVEPGGPPFPGGNPFEGPPAMIKKTVKQIDRITKLESEPDLIREITVGGVERLASGELKQTYSGDKGPSLCPT
jgi:hypothetical protein